PNTWQLNCSTQLQTLIPKANTIAQKDRMEAAKAAVAHASAAVEADKKGQDALPALIIHAAQCALHCRLAAHAYSASGERMAKLQEAYLALKTRIREGGTSSFNTNRILEDLQLILYEGCITTMLGRYYLVQVDKIADPKATAARTDYLLGAEAKAIAYAAAKIWEKNVMERPTRPINMPLGTDLGYKFDLEIEEDRIALGHTLSHITILLCEALKAHYQHLEHGDPLQH
ncbi:MAG: hypothetical protein AAFQ08_03305, partial [Bacteroidota bacterium]